jgi:hypothetical protein
LPRLSLLVLCLAASPAAADDILSFQAPSGNIHCMIATGDLPFARCDILAATPSFRKPPPDCDLDWGHAFGVGPQGPGAPLCAGDTVASADSPVLGYGDRIRLGAFTCGSERSGMTCTNGQGHGFTLSRASQTVF